MSFGVVKIGLRIDAILEARRLMIRGDWSSLHGSGQERSAKISRTKSEISSWRGETRNSRCSVVSAITAVSRRIGFSGQRGSVRDCMLTTHLPAPSNQTTPPMRSSSSRRVTLAGHRRHAFISPARLSPAALSARSPFSFTAGPRIERWIGDAALWWWGAILPAWA